MDENKKKTKAKAKTKSKKKTKKETKPKTPTDINLFDNRVIRLNKAIDKEVAEAITEQFLKLDSMKSKKDIVFYINSPGGNVSDGIAIYDIMQMVKSDVVTICLGRCASMAAVLLSGGTKGKRYITPNSEAMIHEVSSWSFGKVGEIKVDFEHTNTLNERIIKILADNTGKSIEQVRQDIQLKDKWLDAEESLKYGLIDKVLTKTIAP